MRRWAAAVVGLGGTWILACERWADDASVAVFLAFWAALAAAFLAPLPRGRATTARLAAALLAVDVLFDLANPDARIVLRPTLEIARVAILFAVGTALARYTPKDETARAPDDSDAEQRRATVAAVRVLSIARLAAVALVALVGAVAIYALVDGGRADALDDVDAILVLGYALRSDGTAAPSLVARVDRAAEAASHAPRAIVVVSGHASAPGHTEAEVMRGLLAARGIAPERVVLEAEARTTVENFVCAAPILHARGASRVALVTERWHMTRSALLASRLAPGISFLRSPAPSPSVRIAAFKAVREAGGILAELVSPSVPQGACNSR